MDQTMTTSLSAFLDQAWAHLEKGVTDRKHGFHQPVLATVDSDGPRARTVVLRDVSREAGTVACHTDRRTGKATQTHGGAAWCFYDKPLKLQVRVVGEYEILTEGALFEERWAASRLASRRCYLAPIAPGTPTEMPCSNVPAEMTNRDPTESESEAGRENFAVVLCTAYEIDALSLAHDGHTRARWTRSGDGWDGSWIAV